MGTSIPPLFEYNTRESAATLHIAHANGFPPEVYQEMVEPLMGEYHVVALPARPLWELPPPPEDFTGWQVMADDLIAGIEAYQLGPVIGIGHSMGGTASLIASTKRPDLFRALVLLDPVLFPTSTIDIFIRHPHLEFPLVQGALRRRREWESREAAFERFNGRGLFKNWSEAAVWAYVDGLTHSSDNGSIELRYSPEWEARIYQTAPLSTNGWWDWLKTVRIPILTIQGKDTDTFVDDSVVLWEQTRPDLEVIRIPEVGHLFPMEVPQQVAGYVQTFLGAILD
ncbi:MAG: alpha/beta hydrolase [Anaerolineales bacterium]|nr:alpha/beta hydrolase [Anaerolineales bacterium]